MGKSVYIAEKPSVAQEFAKALHTDFKRKELSHSLYASGYFQFYAQNLMRYSYADK